MDSRFLNQPRLEYMKVAIEAAKRLGEKYEKALLRIDAPGWTHVEESSFEEALTKIDQGIAQEFDSQNTAANELIWLGRAWYARAIIEQNKQNVGLASNKIQALPE